MAPGAAAVASSVCRCWRCGAYDCILSTPHNQLTFCGAFERRLMRVVSAQRRQTALELALRAAPLLSSKRGPLRRLRAAARVSGSGSTAPHQTICTRRAAAITLARTRFLPPAATARVRRGAIAYRANAGLLAWRIRFLCSAATGCWPRCRCSTRAALNNASAAPRAVRGRQHGTLTPGAACASFCMLMRRWRRRAFSPQNGGSAFVKTHAA